jgi:transcription initiation factor TFIIH subunit 3
MIVILFDVHAWMSQDERPPSGLSLNTCLQQVRYVATWRRRFDGIQIDYLPLILQICVFIRALLLQDEEAEVSVFVVGSGGATLLGSTVVSETTTRQRRGDICDDITESLTTSIKNRSDDITQSPAWASALLQGLCHARRVTHKETEDGGVEETPPSRILSIVTSPDNSLKYLSYMNAFFAAQRDHVIVDCCNLSSQQSSLFQQGCLLTGGCYIQPAIPGSLLQYLMTAFMADASLRKELRYPSASGVDFRAACFCHHRLVDMGHVCSVCLSVFCSRHDICLTCGANFT